MRTDKGKPSGANKSEGTGIPSKINSKKLKKDARLTDEFTDDDKKLAENVRTNKQNRNTNKLHPTNAGGYKNR